MSFIQIADIVEAFRRCGIGRGDVIMLHSDAMVLAQLPPMPAKQRFDALFVALDEVLGPNGTLVLPTFTYSFTKGEPFVVDKTPSTVGALTEYFRGLPGVLRSRDPIFSIAARGRRAEAFASVPIDDCFGPGSAFGLLEHYDAWVGCLGLGFMVTFTHYVEEKHSVDYRYFKTFSGLLEEKGVRRKADVRYYVRDLNRRSECNLSRLRGRLMEKELLKTEPVGRVALTTVRCCDFLNQAQELLGEQPNALIDEGA